MAVANAHPARPTRTMSMTVIRQPRTHIQAPPLYPYPIITTPFMCRVDLAGQDLWLIPHVKGVLIFRAAARVDGPVVRSIVGHPEGSNVSSIDWAARPLVRLGAPTMTPTALSTTRTAAAVEGSDGATMAGS